MKALILENLALKISAVVLSLLLWFFVTSSGKSQMSFEVTPEFKNIPAGLGIVSNEVKTVVVTIRGQERLMKNVRPSDVRVFVNLIRAKKGEGTYPINRDDIKLPYAMTITDVVPASVRIRLDERTTKSVPIDPVVTGSPAKGFYLKSVAATPRSVVIQGLKTELRKMSVLRTEPMDISGMKETASVELNLETSGMGIKPEVNAVRVTIEIGRK